MSIQADDREVRSLLGRLQEAGLNRKALAAIRRGLNILARKTTEKFRQNRRGFAERRVKRKGRGGKEREKILRVARVSTNRKAQTVKVHIMDDYRVKWFEMGTRRRKTKGRRIVGSAYVGKRKLLVRSGKGHDTGSIRAEWFFRKAQRQTLPQVEKKINDEMTKAIRKL